MKIFMFTESVYVYSIFPQGAFLMHINSFREASSPALQSISIGLFCRRQQLSIDLFCHRHLSIGLFFYRPQLNRCMTLT